MIQVNNLNITYGDRELIKADHLTIYPGRITGIYGKSGCGKTSFLDFLNFEKNFGELVIDDVHINQMSNEEKQSYKYNHITYVSQNHQFIPGLTCNEILEFALHASGSTKKVEELVKQFNLNIDSKTKVEQLSYGQRALFAFAFTIAKDDPIILLDEIFSSMDVNTVNQLIGYVKGLVEKGKYVIISFHDEKTNSIEFLKDYFDDLIYFNEHTISVQKRNNNLDYVNVDAVKKLVNTKLLNKGYRFFQIKSNLLYITLISVCLGLGLFIYNNSKYLTSQIDSISKEVENSLNQIHVISDHDPEKYNFDIMNEYGVEDSQFEQIQKLEHVSNVVPGIPFIISDGYLREDEEYVRNSELLNVSVNGINKNLINNSEEIDYSEFDILPYVDHSYDLVCNGDIDEEGILYITDDIAARLGIVSVSTPTNIAMTVLVPIDSFPYTGGVSINDGPWIMVDVQTMYYTPVEINVRVRGIISDTYPFSVHTDFLLPYSFTLDLYEENKLTESSYRIQEYIVISDSIQNVKTLRESIEFLGLHTYQDGDYYISLWEELQKSYNRFGKYLLGFVVVITILCIYYSFVVYINDQKFFNVINKMGISKKVKNQLKLNKMLFNFILTIGLGFFIILVTYLICRSTNVYYNYISSELSMMIIKMAIPYLILIGVLTQIGLIISIAKRGE